MLALSGELDLSSAGRLLDAVSACCLDGAEQLVLDVGALQFLDSTGLRAILDSRTLCEEHECSFSLQPARERVPYQVRRLLQITGLLDRLPFPPGEPPAA